MKLIITMASLLLLARAHAALSVCQTLPHEGTVSDRRPAGGEDDGTTAAGPAGAQAVGITIGLNIAGGYDGRLHTILASTNGALIFQPDGFADGFGAKPPAIQSQTGGAAALPALTAGLATASAKPAGRGDAVAGVRLKNVKP